MKKDSKTRLFEVMGRLDKTFKPKLNEEFEPASPVAFKQPMGGDEIGAEEKVEQTPEEKIEALTAKVDELYAMLHGEEETGEEETGEESGMESGAENLQEWNFDKKKGEKDDDSESDEKKEDETEEELKEETSTDAPKAKIPVNMIAKVGK